MQRYDLHGNKAVKSFELLKQTILLQELVRGYYSSSAKRTDFAISNSNFCVQSHYSARVKYFDVILSKIVNYMFLSLLSFSPGNVLCS